MKSTTPSPRFVRDNNAFGEAIGKGVRGHRAARVFKAFVLSALLLGAGSAAATAQTGWVVNIDNSGFSPLPAGGQADYKVSIANSDNYLTPASTVVFTIPANTIFTGVSKLSNCSPAAGGAPSAAPFAVTCDLPAILPGTSTDFIVGMKHMQAGTTELKASVPTEPGVASFTRKTTVHEGADLSVELEAAPSPLQAGKIVTLSAVVTNHGPHASKNVKVVLTLPTGLSASGVVMPANCSIAGNLISCDLGDMAADQVLNLEFSTQVIAAEASTATASAQVISGTPRDPNNANDSAVAEIEILEGSDVSLRKSRSPAGLLLLGNTATFTLEPLVAGRVPTSAAITDSVPANYRILSVDAGPGQAGRVMSPGRTFPATTLLQLVRTIAHQSRSRQRSLLLASRSPTPPISPRVVRMLAEKSTIAPMMAEPTLSSPRSIWSPARAPRTGGWLPSATSMISSSVPAMMATRRWQNASP